MQIIPVQTSSPSSTCTGQCSGCGKIHVRIFEAHDFPSFELNERVSTALSALKIPYKLISTSSPEAAEVAGVKQFPALKLEQELVCEGYVPSLTQVVHWLMERYIDRVKLQRIQRITVPVDMSPESGNALRYAAQMAHQLQSQLEVVHVMDSIFEGSKASASGFLASYGDTMQAELDAFIQKALESEATHLQSKVLFGFPDTALIDYSSNTDLMIIGANGHGNLRRRIFGSVSTEVSLQAQCPVLLVPEGASYYGFKHLIYTCDFHSLNPLRVVEAAAFAHRFGAEIHFVHVGAEKEEEGRLPLSELFNQTMAMLPPALQKTDLVRVVGESVMTALYEYAGNHRADLLVFVTHERHFWENLLHHSVTSEALTDAKMPVLVIHETDSTPPEGKE